MRVEVESFEPETDAVRVRTSVGSFSAIWRGDEPPAAGQVSEVEFSTDPTAEWGSDVTPAAPDEPDSISEDEKGWTFVGTVLGIDPDGASPYYVKDGRVLPPHDLEDGVFYLEIDDADTLMFATDRLDPDAAGRRVRVRQAKVELYPYDTGGYTVETKIRA